MTNSKRYFWLKLRRDFFKRHDIRIIEGMEDGREMVLFYLKLLLESIDHQGKLRFSEKIPYTEIMLGTITNTDTDIVGKAMEALKMLDLVEVTEDGTIYLHQAEEMTGFESEWAKKKREYRDRLGHESDIVPEMSDECPDGVPELSDKSKNQNKSKTELYNFVPPTIEEIVDYCEGRHNNVNPQLFFDYYEARGWRNIVDWKALVRVWENNQTSSDQ